MPWRSKLNFNAICKYNTSITVQANTNESKIPCALALGKDGSGNWGYLPIFQHYLWAKRG